MSETPKVIKAKFLETEEHHVTAWERNPSKPRLNFLILLSFGLALVFTAPDAVKSFKKEEGNWWVPHAIIIPVMIGLWLWFGPIGTKRRIRSAARKFINNPPTDTWLDFTEESLMITGRAGKNSFHPWSSMPRALHLKDGIVVFFEDHEYAYYWIPQSAFASAEDYEKVLGFAKSKIARFTDRQSSTSR